MFCIPKSDDYSKIFTDEEGRDFAAMNFSEFLKSTREEQNLRKVAKSLYIFLKTPDEVEKYVKSNSFGNCVHHYNVEILIITTELQLINTKLVIKDKSKELLSDFKKFKVKTTLVLDYKKRNDH